MDILLFHFKLCYSLIESCSFSQTVLKNIKFQITGREKAPRSHEKLK